MNMGFRDKAKTILHPELRRDERPGRYIRKARNAEWE
jgi:hypothetical protein